MSRVFASHFPRRATFLAVVHSFEMAQVERETEVAFECGADGVFLIAGRMSWRELSATHEALRAKHPARWIGLNCLDLDPEDAFLRVPRGVSGLWTDNAGLSANGSEPHPFADAIATARATRPDVLYFGGVAFKYQRDVTDLEGVARAATRFVDVVTTSGDATGEPPAKQKIERLRAALGDFPLAIASGITPENVGDYLGLCDCFLVATGISKNSAEFDPPRVRALAAQIRNFV